MAPQKLLQPSRSLAVSPITVSHLVLNKIASTDNTVAYGYVGFARIEMGLCDSISCHQRHCWSLAASRDMFSNQGIYVTGGWLQSRTQNQACVLEKFIAQLLYWVDVRPFLCLVFPHEHRSTDPDSWHAAGFPSQVGMYPISVSIQGSTHQVLVDYRTNSIKACFNAWHWNMYDWCSKGCALGGLQVSIGATYPGQKLNRKN